MGKKRITREERYQQLIQCSTKIFAKKGYKSTTTKDISKVAGVSEKMIYVHFKSKKELFLKCLNTIEQDMRDNYRSIMRQYKENPIDCLEKIGIFLFEYLNKNKYTAGILSLHAREVHDKTIKDEYKKIISMYADSIEIIIKKAIDKGVAHPDLNPRAAAWIFVGSYNTFLLMQEFSLKEFNRDFVTQFIDIIIMKSIAGDQKKAGSS